MSIYTLHAINGLCGSSKTQHIIDRAVRRAAVDGLPSLIIAPTKKLCEEIKLRILTSSRNAIISVRVIHSDNAEMGKDGYPSVMKTLVGHITNPDCQESDILIITHAEWDLVPWQRWWKWMRQRKLFVDEIPTVEAYVERRLPTNHHYLTDNFHLFPHADYPDWSWIDMNDELAMKDIATNKDRDVITETIQNPAYYIASDNWCTYVNNTAYEQLLGGEDAFLRIHALRRPECFNGWDGVEIAGALFDKSPLYNQWQGRVQWEMEHLDDGRHANGSRLTIYYGVTGLIGMSKNKRKTLTNGTGRKFTEVLAERVVEAWGGVANTEILTLRNKGLDGGDYSGSVELPGSPYGTNDYRDYHYVCIPAGFHHKPAHVNFLKEVGRLVVLRHNLSRMFLLYRPAQ
jgi:hypothetical protein